MVFAHLPQKSNKNVKSKFLAKDTTPAPSKAPLRDTTHVTLQVRTHVTHKVLPKAAAAPKIVPVKIVPVSRFKSIILRACKLLKRN